MILKKLCIIYRRKFFLIRYKKILFALIKGVEKKLNNFFLNFFLNFFCNKKMSMNFKTTLNNKTFRGTVNVNEALEALKGHSWP